MQITVTKEFSFDAAHHLTKYYGKCERVHGHTYKLFVTVKGELSENDMLIDFVILKRVVTKHILSKLDHRDLNGLFPNPTTEVVALWIWDQLKNLNELLKEELDDPNLDTEIKKYLTETDEKIDNNADFKIQLHEIKLYESPTSFVTLNNG